MRDFSYRRNKSNFKWLNPQFDELGNDTYSGTCEVKIKKIKMAWIRENEEKEERERDTPNSKIGERGLKINFL